MVWMGHGLTENAGLSNLIMEKSLLNDLPGKQALQMFQRSPSDKYYPEFLEYTRGCSVNI